MEALSGLTAKQASQRPIPTAHTIWEIAQHICAWKEIVRQRIIGNYIEATDEQDWPPVKDPGESQWEPTLARLKTAHEDLIKTISGMDRGG